MAERCVGGAVRVREAEGASVKTKRCPECGRDTVIRFEWAQTALPAGQSYWRCALMPDACWAGPFVMATP